MAAETFFPACARPENCISEIISGLGELAGAAEEIPLLLYGRGLARADVGIQRHVCRRSQCYGDGDRLAG